ncbi:MAG: O-antigen ligase family protein [Candidatus Brocadiia bacterium]
MKRKTTDAGRRAPRIPSAAPPPESAALALRVRQIAFAITLVAAGLGPLAPNFEGNPVLRLIIQMFFILSGALWVIAMALEGRVRIRSTGLEIILLLLAGALVCGCVNAVYKYPAMLTLFSWLSAMVAFVFLVNETRSRWRRLMVLLMIGAATFTISLDGLHQITVDLPRARAIFAQDPDAVLRDLRLPADAAFDLYGRLEKDRIFSTFFLPNSLAGFLILLAPALIGMTMDWWKSRPTRIGGEREGDAPGGRAPAREFSTVSLAIRAGLLIPVLLALYFTKSKGGWLAFLLAAAVFAVWAFGTLLWRRRLQVMAACAGLIIVWAAAQASGHLPALGDYFGSTSVRYGYWRAGVSIFAEHPLVGIGLDNFADFYAQKKQAEDQEARRAHNDYIQLAAETGLIGILTYLAFLALFWRKVAHMGAEPVLAQPEPAALNATATAGLLALSAVILGLEELCGGALRASAGFWSWQWLAALWLGWMAYLLLNARRQDPFALGRSSYATLGVACGIIAFLVHSLGDFHHYIGGTLQTAWILMAVLLSARLSEEKESYAVDRPIGPGQRLGLVLGAAAVVLLVLYGFVARVAEANVLRERALEPRRPEEDCRRDLVEAVRQFPMDAENHALLSDFYLGEWRMGRRRTEQNVSAISLAIYSAKAAIELDPMRSEFYARLGRLYEIQWRERRLPQDYQDALAAYVRAEELFPSNPEMPLNLGRLYDAGGNDQAALPKYLGARRLSEEQYHIPRKFNDLELAELSRRIQQLQQADVDRTPPPPNAFRQPRLLGWPRGEAP